MQAKQEHAAKSCRGAATGHVETLEKDEEDMVSPETTGEHDVLVAVLDGCAA